MIGKPVSVGRRKLVVHCFELPYDVYIGRGRDPFTQELGQLGNQWSHLPSSMATHMVNTVEDAVQCHKRWANTEVLHNHKFAALVKSLYDPQLKTFKVLGCWCRSRRRPRALCHGATLLEICARLNGVPLNVEDI